MIVSWLNVGQLDTSICITVKFISLRFTSIAFQGRCTMGSIHQLRADVPMSAGIALTPPAPAHSSRPPTAPPTQWAYQSISAMTIAFRFRLDTQFTTL